MACLGRRPPRTWSRCAAAWILALAVVVAELGLSARGAASDVCHDPGSRGVDGLSVGIQISKEHCGEIFDHVANLFDPATGIHRCTGSLVGPGVVVTTATCLNEFPPGVFPDVRTGSVSANEDGTPGAQVSRSCKKITHKDFEAKERRGPDLALVTLEQKAHHEPVQNTLLLDECPNKNISFVGWFNPPFPLHGVHPLTIVAKEDCERLIGGIHEKSVCAKTHLTTHPVYDAGGLLLCDGKDLVGVASRTEPGKTYFPIAFTEVTHFKDWIKNPGKADSIVAKNEECEPEL